LKDGKVSTLTENAGGILGGLSSGMPILIRAAIKPTPSIAKQQNTVDMCTLENTTLSVKGRHDPCIVPKAVPAIEASVAIILADHMIRSGYIPRILKEH
jgi:chorismate synthase